MTEEEWKNCRKLTVGLLTFKSYSKDKAIKNLCILLFRHFGGVIPFKVGNIILKF